MTAEQRLILESLAVNDNVLSLSGRNSIVAALADVDACLKALRDVEWEASGYDGFQTVPACPCCRTAKYNGHAYNCGLAAVLAAAGEEPAP